MKDLTPVDKENSIEHNICELEKNETINMEKSYSHTEVWTMVENTLNDHYKTDYHFDL